MKKKKIEKFVTEMDANNCAVVLMAGEKGLSDENTDCSFAVAGNFNDVLILCGMFINHMYKLLSQRMSDEEAKNLLIGLVGVATKKEDRQRGTADGQKGE